MDKKSTLTLEAFDSNFNCCQSVVCAFEKETNLKKDELLKIASSFGGGIGGMKETCGAVCGMFIVLGLAAGYTDPSAENKSAHTEKLQNLAKIFADKFGSLKCSELKPYDVIGHHPICKNYVTFAADAVNEMLIKG